jgi:hypothetical protein
MPAAIGSTISAAGCGCWCQLRSAISATSSELFMKVKSIAKRYELIPAGHVFNVHAG